MTISAVVWDLGGVLVRTEDPRMRQQLADKLMMDRSDLEERVFGGESGSRAQLGEITVSEHWQNVSLSFGMEREDLEEFQRLFWGGDRVDYELIEFIRTLRNRCRTGLLSNAFSDLRQYMTSVWQISDVFDAMVISSEVGYVKPDPEIYRLILERLEVLPHQAVLIDDMLANVEGARKAGMQAIRFRSSLQVRQDLINLLDGGAG
jgi:epoxide hydrolase-like predicted phosphatase